VGGSVGLLEGGGLFALRARRSSAPVGRCSPLLLARSLSLAGRQWRAARAGWFWFASA